MVSSADPGIDIVMANKNQSTIVCAWFKATPRAFDVKLLNEIDESFKGNRPARIDIVLYCYEFPAKSATTVKEVFEQELKNNPFQWKTKPHMHCISFRDLFGDSAVSQVTGDTPFPCGSFVVDRTARSSNQSVPRPRRHRPFHPLPGQFQGQFALLR